MATIRDFTPAKLKAWIQEYSATAEVETIQYTAVTTTPYTIVIGDLIHGTNIFGCDAGEDVTVNLPVIDDPTKLVYIQNESVLYDVFTNFIL